MLQYLCSLLYIPWLLTSLSLSIRILAVQRPNYCFFEVFVKIYLSAHTNPPCRKLATNRSVTTETSNCHMHNWTKRLDLGKDEKVGAGGKERDGRENKINVHLVQTEGTGATRWCHHRCKAGLQPHGAFSLLLSVSVTHSCQSTTVYQVQYRW